MGSCVKGSGTSLGPPAADAGPRRDAGQPNAGSDFVFLAATEGTTSNEPEDQRNRIYSGRFGEDPVALTDSAPILFMIVTEDRSHAAYLALSEGGPTSALYAVPTTGDAAPTRVDQPYGATGLGSVSNPAWSPTSSRLVYTASERSDAELFAVDADGSAHVRINGDLMGGRAYDAEWSSRGDRVVYRGEANEFGPIELFSARADGTDNVQIHAASSQFFDVDDVSISPDGTRVLYRAEVRSNEHVFFTARLDGTEVVRVSGEAVNGGSTLRGARWSPDSTRLAFFGTLEAADDIALYTVMANGDDLVKITSLYEQPREDGHFAWSPDGSLLAYGVFDEIAGTRALYVGTNDAQSATMVSGSGTVKLGRGEFVWSPDSRRLAFRSDRDGNDGPELYVWTVDERAFQVSGPNDPGGFGVLDQITWSPGGTRLTYAAREGVTTHLYSVEPTGAGHVDLTAAIHVQSRVEGLPKWIADDRIAFVARNGGNGFHLYTMAPDGTDLDQVSAALGATAIVFDFVVR